MNKTTEHIFTKIFYCHLFPNNMRIKRCLKYTTVLIENIIYNQFTIINIMYKFECILLLCAVRAGMRMNELLRKVRGTDV